MKKVYRIYQINGYSTKEMGFTASKKQAVKKILAACEANGGVLYLKQGDLYEYGWRAKLLRKEGNEIKWDKMLMSGKYGYCSSNGNYIYYIEKIELE